MHSHAHLSLWVLGDLKSGPHAFIVHRARQSIHNPCFFRHIVFYSLQLPTLSFLECIFVIVDCSCITVTAQLSLSKFSLNALVD